MATLDLDQLRSEAGLEPHSFTVGGRTFDCPAILPFGVMEAPSTAESFRLLCDLDDDGVEFLMANLSKVRSDRPLSEFDIENPESDLDIILEKLYGITRPRPNREARRAGEKADKKTRSRK